MKVTPWKMDVTPPWKIVVEATRKRNLSSNPETSPDILTTLSQDQDWVVRWNVVRNPSTPYGIWIPIHDGYGRAIP